MMSKEKLNSYQGEEVPGVSRFLRKEVKEVSEAEQEEIDKLAIDFNDLTGEELAIELVL